MNEKTNNEKAALNAKAQVLRIRANALENMPKLRKRLLAQAVTMETQAMHLGETPRY